MKRFQWMIIGLCITAGAGMAQAIGTVWENTPDAGNAADPANMASSLPHANFTTTGINYCTTPFCVAPYTVGAFLGNPTFTGAVNGFSSSASDDNTEVQLSGTVLLTAGANNFTIEHDDGLTLALSGGPGTTTCSIQMGTLCVDQPGPTPPAGTAFTVNATAAGTYNFVLDYAECCGAPAVLMWAYQNGTPVGTPEPGSIVLMGTAACGIVWSIRRRRRKA